MVLLLDEVDALVGDTLISLLRQLRAGYPKRPTQFPQTVILCSVRDLQDYRIHASSEATIITGGSAFNIKAKSLFLHRVVNGDGTLEREYAIGRGRMDLCLRYGVVTLGIELKVWRDGEPDPLTEGLEQLDGYLAGLGLNWGWLVIFDRRSGQPPIRERTSSEQKQSPQERRMTVVRA